MIEVVVKFLLDKLHPSSTSDLPLPGEQPPSGGNEGASSAETVVTRTGTTSHEQGKRRTPRPDEGMKEHIVHSGDASVTRSTRGCVERDVRCKEHFARVEREVEEQRHAHFPESHHIVKF